MINHNVLLILYRNTIALFCAASISISPAVPKECVVDARPICVFTRAETDHNKLLAGSLWRYLRRGINYLEASGKNAPTYFKHPGGAAYGPLALTPIAIKDVKLHHPSMSRYSVKDVIKHRDLYEKFAVLYADLLLRHYIKIDYSRMSKEEIFEILEKAWFLGPGLYKQGHPVISSRESKAREYLAKRS